MKDDALQELIERCAERDVVAFEQLVRKYQSFAFALSLRLLYDESESEDVVQESFIRLWNHMDKYDPKRKFTTWLYTIVTNLCLDRIRSQKRSRTIFTSGEENQGINEIPDDVDLSEVHSNRELAGMIKELSGQLPLKQRLVFTLRDLQDLSVEEVAEITRMSIASVKTNLHYARKRIRGLMAEHYNVRRVQP